MLLIFLLGLLASFVHAIPTISTKGAKFFTSDGNQFFVKGRVSSLPAHDLRSRLITYQRRRLPAPSRRPTR
jgi:hypothetical protein